jgi:hypothetical protein
MADAEFNDPASPVFLHPVLEEARRSFSAFYRVATAEDQTWFDALVLAHVALTRAINVSRPTVVDPDGLGISWRGSVDQVGRDGAVCGCSHTRNVQGCADMNAGKVGMPVIQRFIFHSDTLFFLRLAKGGRVNLAASSKFEEHVSQCAPFLRDSCLSSTYRGLFRLALTTPPTPGSILGSLP